MAWAKGSEAGTPSLAPVSRGHRVDELRSNVESDWPHDTGKPTLIAIWWCSCLSIRGCASGRGLGCSPIQGRDPTVGGIGHRC